ncbi:MAG: hypothetical protein M3N15_05665, partial [Actinomycetota bacterium]|nr:hypothetical protein [Actinomycetota bacterium]
MKGVLHILSLALVALTPGCAGGTQQTSTAGGEEQPAVIVPAPTTSLPPDPGRRASAPLAELDEVRVSLTEVATADAPVAMTTRPGHDGVLFVAERAGRVVVIDHGTVRPRPLLEVATTTDGERG